VSDQKWIPEIMYEETAEGGSSQIPFIMVPPEQEMPSLIYIFESRDTGEFEPGLEGEEVPVVQWDLHQYADMAILKERLSSQLYDTVRLALGLENLKNASEKGSQITDNIRNNIS
jgi:hypothetical protein